MSEREHALLIDVVRPNALSDADIAAWRAIQAADPSLDSPFLSPDWAQAVERVQAGRRGAIQVAVLREADKVVGFLPARVVGAVAMPVGAPMCDYQGLVAAPGVHIEPKRLVEAFGVQRLDFSHMLADKP